jgi:hypothetical protein
MLIYLLIFTFTLRTLVLTLKRNFALQDFYDFAVKSRLFTETHHEDKTVYVVPAFEARETVSSPRTKTELLKLVDGGHVRPFYIELCWKCQVMFTSLHLLQR